MADENKEKKKIKLFTWPLIIISLAGGVISYLYAGYTFEDALYSAVDMFAFNIDDIPLNAGLRIFRWLAPLSVATTLFIEIAPIFRWFRDRIVFFAPGSGRTIIYSDCEAGSALYDNMEKHAVLRRECTPFALSDNANRSVILMKNDKDALSLFRKLGRPDNSFLCLNSMEPSLIPSSGNTVVSNINDIIAGYFWHKEFMAFAGKNTTGGLLSWRGRDGIPVFRKENDRCFRIVIYGFTDLGKRLLYKGLLFNIFSPSQHIIYHVYDPDHKVYLYRKDINNAVSVNGDKVLFHDNPDDLAKILNEADAIIIPGSSNPRLIQELLYSTIKPELYYYDPEGVGYETVFDSDECEVRDGLYGRLHAFGSDKKIFIEKYILHSSLIEKARMINEDYLISNPGEGHVWEELSGFDKGSNVNAADYIEIGSEVSSWDMFSLDELASLEHDRWRRYNYLNHQGSNSNPAGNSRYFVPFSELDEADKEKNRRIVRLWTF